MKALEKSAIPPRPWNVAPTGSLVVGRGINNSSPKLVLETKSFWGNPNGDNTAEHWHWKYLLINEMGKPTWSLAKFWKIFSAA